MNHFKTILSIFVFILSANIFAKENYSFVYVHLGNKVPEYLYDSIQQTRLFNPETEIYVVCYKEVSNEIKLNLENIKYLNVVITQDLDISNEHAHFLKNVKRPGFWQFASERFFYIEQVMRKYNLENVFHLESDNLLYVDLNEYIDIFKQNYPGIAATFDNDNRCIAGFMYIKNIDSIHELNNLFSGLAKFDYNDMQVIAHFKKIKPNLIDNLPIIPDSYKIFFPLKNNIGNIANVPNIYSKNFELFNSIFDAAALGQYLGGIDPIHRNSKPG